MRDAAVVIGQRVLRIEPDRGVVAGDGAVDIALPEVGGAAVVIGDREVAVDLDRAVEIGKRAIGVALRGRGDAAIVIGQREDRADRIGCVSSIASRS